MKAQFLFFQLFLLFIMTGNTYAQSAADEAQIRKVVSTMKDGWNAKSGETFASVFADNHDYIVWTGMFARNISRAENAKQHQEIFDTFYRNTRMENEISKIKMIRDDLSLVHFNAKLWDKDIPEPKDWDVLVSILIEKQNDQWLIISFHNCDLEKGTGPGAGAYYAKQEATIKNQVNTLATTWNGRDAEALAALFVDGYDHVVVNHSWTTDFSREACQAGHQHLFKTVYTEPGTGNVANVKVQFLKSDVALVHAKLEDKSLEGDQQELLTLVFEMDKYENWLIRSFDLNLIAKEKPVETTGEISNENN